MAAMLDQSLDAMIKETRKTAPKRRANATKNVGGKRAPAKGSAKNSSRGPAPMSIGTGGVKKASMKKAKKRSAGAMAMAVDRLPRQQQQQRSNGGAVGHKTQLIVSNLDWKVTDQDIKELFGQVGRVFKAGVNYGPDGRSKGTADVTIGSYDQALKAVQTYNGVKLDGRPLSITIVGAKPQSMSITQRLSGLKQPLGKGKQNNKPTPKATPNRGKATAKAVANAKGAAPKKKAPKKKAPKKKAADAPKATAADLDAQLDSYKAGADVQMTA